LDATQAEFVLFEETKGQKAKTELDDVCKSSSKKGFSGIILRY
jgi:hypothetical protein